jgi:hypothetical protein
MYVTLPQSWHHPSAPEEPDHPSTASIERWDEPDGSVQRWIDQYQRELACKPWTAQKQSSSCPARLPQVNLPKVIKGPYLFNYYVILYFVNSFT